MIRNDLKQWAIYCVVVAKRTFLNHIVDVNKKVAFKNAPQRSCISVVSNKLTIK